MFRLRLHPLKSLLLISLCLLFLPSVKNANAQESGPTRSVLITSSADSGPGTLREALADLQSGDLITFDPDVFPLESPATIMVKSPMRPINAGNVTIDATGAGVILDGTQMVPYPEDDYATAIVIFSDNNVIMGLQIINFPGDAIYIEGSHGNRIGGARTSATGACISPCNLLSGNELNGVSINRGGDNIVQGNFLGTDITGTLPYGNGVNGARVDDSSGNLIGGEGGAGNLISANSIGVEINEPGANFNQVIGNYIGVDVTGTKTLGNLHAGISVYFESHDNLFEGNIISGNEMAIVFGGGSHDNTVTNNYIGTNPALASDIGNSSNAIGLESVQDNVIGPGNFIMWNGWVAVFISQPDTVGNRITQNVIEHNGEISFRLNNVEEALFNPPEGLAVNAGVVTGQTQSFMEVEIYTGSDVFEGRYIGTTTSRVDGTFRWVVPADIALDDYVTALAFQPDGTTTLFGESAEVPQAVLQDITGMMTPQQVSKDIKVWGINAGLAVLILLYCSMMVKLFDKTLESYSDLIDTRLLTPLREWFKQYFPKLKRKPKGQTRSTARVWLDFVILIVMVALVQSFLELEIDSFWDWAGLVLNLFLAALIVSGLLILSERIYRRRIHAPVNERLTKIRWAGLSLATGTMLFSRVVHFIPGFILGAVDPMYYQPEIEDPREEAVRILVTKGSVFLVTLVGWLLYGWVESFAPWLAVLLQMCFYIALEGFFMELIPFFKVLDGYTLLKWDFWAWAGLFIPVMGFTLQLVFNPKGDGISAIQQNTMQALIAVMVFIPVALLMLKGLCRWMENNAVRECSPE